MGSVRNVWFKIAIIALLVALGSMLILSCGKAPAEAVDQDIYGMHLQPQLLDQHQEVFGEMQALGVKWVRTNLFWFKIEPEEGRFDWQALDDLVWSAENHGLRLMFSVRAISPWGSIRVPPNWDQPGYHAASPPKDMQKYSNFVGALAARYRGKGIAWQVENEPNAPILWDGSREEYIALLEAFYAAAHGSDPEALVLPAGLGCGFSIVNASGEQRLAAIRPWFDAILDSGAFDALDIHDYYPPQADNPWGMTFGQYIEAHRQWMYEKDIHVPLWISEAGVSSEPVEIKGETVPFTPKLQSSDLESIMEIASQNDIAHVFWLKLVDAPPEGPFTHMGLMTSLRQKKPAWDTYQRLASK